MKRIFFLLPLGQGPGVVPDHFNGVHGVIRGGQSLHSLPKLPYVLLHCLYGLSKALLEPLRQTLHGRG